MSIFPKSKDKILSNSVKNYQDQTSVGSTGGEGIRLARRDSLEKAQQRLEIAGASQTVQDCLLSSQAREDFDAYKANIENYIGTVSLPVGLAGPALIQGSYAKGEYYIPLATTEAALVASYNRGLQAMRASGGCVAMVVDQGVQRAPLFTFSSLVEANQFVLWVNEQRETLSELAEATTRHGKLIDLDYQIESNLVSLIFKYSTGSAAGQNMVTLATEAAYRYILEHSPVKPQRHYLEGNTSGEKKASLQSLMDVRGYKVSVEARMPREVVKQYLHVEPEEGVRYMQASRKIAALAAPLCRHAHIANGLAAMYIACGQDVACVAESAIGITYGDCDESGHLYATLTMPNIIVGTVGGGTQLPDQKACLQLLNLSHPSNTAAELAEIIAVVCLAGEISLTAAMVNDEYADAHRSLARIRKSKVCSAGNV